MKKFTITKDLFLQLREAATTTCNNAYLMDDGKIITARQFKTLSFEEKMKVVMFYQYKSGTVIKI